MGSPPWESTGSRTRRCYATASRTGGSVSAAQLEVRDGLRVWKLLRRLLLERDHQADDTKAQVALHARETARARSRLPDPGRSLPAERANCH
jgi:hypothetical protein